MKEQKLIALAAELARQASAYNFALAETLQSMVDSSNEVKLELKTEQELRSESEQTSTEANDAPRNRKRKTKEETAKEETAKEASVKEPAKETQTKEEPITSESIRKECMRLVRVNSSMRPAIVELLAKFGAETVKDLKPEDYQTVINELLALEQAADFI